MVEGQDFGQRVRDLRKRLGMSQRELAERVGYSQMAISKIESGKLAPNDDKASALARALGSSTTELLGKPSKGGLALTQAVKASRANQRRRAALEAGSNNLRRRIELPEAELDALRDTVKVEFLETALVALAAFSDVDAEDLASRWAQDFQRFDAPIGVVEHQAHVVGTLATVAKGVLVGSKVGAGAAAATYAAVGAFATSSTGTAIASLSGVAASNATLAFLGGGSLAAGGAGMAGGSAVLTGIVAAPALLGGAIALTYAGRKMLKAAQSETEQIELAESQLEVAETTVDALLPYLDKTKTTLRIALDRGKLELDWLQKLQSKGGVSDWHSLSESDQRRVERIFGLTALIFSILPLPVAIQSDTDDSDLDQIREQIRVANDAVLEPTLRWLYSSPAHA